MKVGYVVLYEDGELVISKNHTLLQKRIIKDYGAFEDISVPWKNETSKIKKVQILDQIKSNCMKAWFKGCINLTTLINFKKLDVSYCTDFSSMFSYCESLQNLNELQTWNVSNGENFSFMFFYCESLENLNGLQNWNVSNGTDFSSIFYKCNSLQDLNGLQNWNVSNGIYFSYMFAYCETLKKISLSNTFKNLTKEMFKICNPNLKIYWKNHIYIYEDLLEYEKIY